MAQPARQYDAAPQQAASQSTPSATVAIDAQAAPPMAGIMSPARAMQETLGREFAGVEQAEVWPLRRTVATVILTCGLFWTAVYFAVAAIVG